MERLDAFVRVAGVEELAATACAVAASWVPDCEAELNALAAEHWTAARQLHARPRRWLQRLVTLRGTVAAAVGSPLGALQWLRAQEQRLVDAYVALEGSLELDDSARQRLRRQLVPAAFER